ncbi:MAG: DNA-binding response regulator [Desulforudis sp.]|jgi:DNA-binding response OmpR family regulator|nr:MAG: DNA-binding response regulator [Desulforudis sp.]
MANILVVDDERMLVKGLKRSLEQEGYAVFTAYDGPEALDVFHRESIDLVVLDVMLPGLGGLEVCSRIRRERETPIIMLTAKGEDVDRIVGLELGADDYVVKPFNTRELIARIRAVLRRVRVSDQTADGIIEIQGLTIDSPKRKVFVHGVEVDLTAKEFDMLQLMAAHPGRVYTRENLLEAVWGSAYYSDLRTVDVHIRRLREKLEGNSKKPEWVLTKWGVGYYFKEKV